MSKILVMISKRVDAFPNFPGKQEQEGEYVIAKSSLTHDLAMFLRKQFPFTAPQSLKGKDATIGTGDRLGLANPAHIRAVREYDIFPVLAQQSIRELNFTKRTYDDVLDAATFAVFQEGYEDGFGFDGDHLKKIEEIIAILEDVKSNLAKVHEHGTRADGIVKSMLQHSRASNNKMESKVDLLNASPL